MTGVRRLAACVFPLAVAAVLAAPASYEVYAIRFATIANFRVASLIAGADPARRLDIAMTV